jgi:hypothetical protein
MSAADPIAANFDANRPIPGRLRAASWAISGVLHLTLMLLLAMVLGGDPLPADTPDRPSGIALVSHREPDESAYFAKPDASPSDRATTASPNDSAAVPDDTTKIDVNEFLPDDPSNTPLLPPGAGTGKIVLSRSRPKLGGGGDRPEDVERVSKPGPPRPRVRLNLFDGVEAEGNRFVFVLDHSNSMGGAHLAILHEARREILAQIDRLDDRHAFQIIAYNNRLDYFNRGGLLPATEQNKRNAHKFVEGVTASGGTKHYLALASALRMKPPPDVIFLLTDADEPHPTGGDLAELRRRATGRCSINVVQFGNEPLDSPSSFFTRLARETGGIHGYLDVTARRGR